MRAAAAAAAGSETPGAPSPPPPPPPPRHKRTLWLTGCALVLVLGVAGSIIMWGTTLWDDYIDSQLVIRNGTQAFEGWTNSQVTALISYWIFNYTNADAFFAGREPKLRVREAGPYTFRERVSRVNVVFNDNHTITFQERKVYTFLPEASNGSYSDRITSLNVVYLTANYLQSRMSFLERLSVLAAIQIAKPKPLETRTAREWLWGYKDGLTALAELREGPIQNGFLQSANGTQAERLTIRTGGGEVGVAGLGLITRFNGQEAMDFYADEECNRVDGSDGSRFPPPALRPGATVHIYHREACRRVPLVHREDVTVWDGVPAMRFSVPDDLFANGDDQPDNACYCRNTTDDRCYPSGVINTRHCIKGAPLFASFPHFLHGDPRLLEAVEGLRPDPERHRMYVDIHQRIGATVGLMSRFQMSMLVKDGFKDALLRRLDGLILPWLWTERTLETYPEDLRATFRLVSFVAPAARAALLWTCPLMAVASALALLVYAWAAGRGGGEAEAVAHVASKDEMTRL